MKDVKNILNILIQQNVHEESWKLQLVKNWPTVIGSLHDKISLQKIQATTIVLGVKDTNWMQELYLLSKMIIKKINDSLDKPRITAIRFQCVEKKAEKITTPKKITPENKPISLSSQQIQALEKIEDPELLQALQGFLKKCLQ
jgi:hypothetical protein